MRMKVELGSLHEVMKSIDKYGDRFCKYLGPAVLEGAKAVRDEARSRVHSISGDLAESITADITWDKNKSKAFAAVYIPKSYNDKFVVTTKDGKRYYIPTAVEYGHAGPGGGGFTALAIDKDGNYKVYKKGRKKGQIKKASAKTKTVKPHPFMRPAMKAKKGAVVSIVERHARKALRMGGE